MNTTTPITDYTKVFELFCGKDELRPNMMTPFKQDGYYCAVDGHMAIFMQTFELDLPFEERANPAAVKIIPLANQEVSISVKQLKDAIMEKIPFVDGYD